MDTGTCRSCGAQIRWGVTAKRRRIPLDFEPVADGNVVVRDGVAHVLTAQGTLGEEPSGERYVSHFATCPDAREHRRRR